MKLMQRYGKKVMALALVGALTLSIGAGAFAGAAIKGKIVVAGSSALLPLTQQASKEFRKSNPGVSISASASSSIAGPQSVMKGSAQIGACDWDATQEVPGFKAFTELKAYKVAVIPFATVVNKNVDVKSLDMKQLQGIYSGKITNWKEVGGKEGEIIVINRKFGSGTRVNYQQKALGGADFMKPGVSKNYKEVGSSGEMKTAVQTTPNAIGYIDLVYVGGDMKAVGFEGVEATVENTIDGKYKIYGYGYYLTKGEATGATQAFIEYVKSQKFQMGSLKKMKFIPIDSMK
jgi:phosphate transport system substrate-binding protein